MVGNRMCKYADDTYLIIPASNIDTRTTELDNVTAWAKMNNFRLNCSKSCVQQLTNCVTRLTTNFSTRLCQFPIMYFTNLYLHHLLHHNTTVYAHALTHYNYLHTLHTYLTVILLPKCCTKMSIRPPTLLSVFTNVNVGYCVKSSGRTCQKSKCKCQSPVWRTGSGNRGNDNH